MSKYWAIRTHRKGELGVSLAELVVVSGITAILAAVGIPKYMSFMASARQSEAKNNLSHIYTLEQTYMHDAEVYGTMSEYGPGGRCPASTNEISFKLLPCERDYSDKVRYTYKVTVGASTDQFLAEAYTGAGSDNRVSGCSVPDGWIIDHNRNLVAGDDPANEVEVLPVKTRSGNATGKDTSKSCH